MNHRANTTLYLSCIMTFVIFIVALTAPMWQTRVDAFRWLSYRNYPVPTPVAQPTTDLQPLYDQVGLCLWRTEHLRFTLESLIRVWPGRGALPELPGGWPKAGIGYKWKKTGWEQKRGSKKP